LQGIKQTILAGRMGDKKLTLKNHGNGYNMRGEKEKARPGKKLGGTENICAIVSTIIPMLLDTRSHPRKQL